jgi:hypothetical protein
LTDDAITDKDKRPSFQFYPGDWMSDLKLRRCSPAARGVWVDVLCAMHDSDDAYGILRWPLKEIARTVGASLAHMRELVGKGVLRGSDTNLIEPLVYVPRSGRKAGPPITLIPTQPGPIWYSKRLVKDDYVRTHRGEATRFGAPPNASPKGGKGEPEGDGSSSSSPSSPSGNTSEDLERAERAQAQAEADGFTPTPAGAVCKAMRQAGFAATNPGDPRLLALLQQGATQDEFVGIATEAAQATPPKGWGWVLTVVQKRREEAAAIALAPPAPAPSATVPSAAANDTQRYLAEQAAHQRTAPAAEVRERLAALTKAMKVAP